MSPSLAELEALILLVANRPGGELDLRALTRRLPDGEALTASLAWEHVPPATLAHQLVIALHQRGPLPAALLQALAEARPSLLPRLCALAPALGLEPPAAPPGQRERLLPVARALTQRLGADPRPALALLPEAPAAETWLDVLLDADAPVRGRLLALVWPAGVPPTRAALRQHLAAVLGASTLTPIELLAITQKAGVVVALPVAERLDAFLDELLVAERTDERLLGLVSHTSAALPREEADAFAIAELTLRVDAEQKARDAELERALRLAMRALLAKLWATRRGRTPVEPALDEALGVPPLSVEALDADTRLDHERALDEAEALADTLRFRATPWAWLRAAVLVQRAARGGLDPEQQARATALQARLRPRLRWLAAGGGVSAWVVLTLLSAAFPLYVWGLASAALALLFSWLRLVAPVSATAVAMAGWFWTAIPDNRPPVEGQDAPDPLTMGHAQEIIDQILGPPQARPQPGVRQPEAWAGLVPDDQGRVSVPETPPEAVEAPPPPPPPSPTQRPPRPKPVEAPPEPTGDPTNDVVTETGTGADQTVDGEATAIPPPDQTTGAGEEVPKVQDPEPGAHPPIPRSEAGGPTGKNPTTTAIPDATMTFVELSGGSFWMGAPETEANSLDSERPQHKVKVSTFAIGRAEVTQAQWAATVTAAQKAGIADAAGLKVDPSAYKGGQRPVETVSWCDAARFANALSHLEGKRPAYTVGSDCEGGGSVPWDPAAYSHSASVGSR